MHKERKQPALMLERLVNKQQFRHSENPYIQLTLLFHMVDVLERLVVKPKTKH